MDQEEGLHPDSNHTNSQDFPASRTVRNECMLWSFLVYSVLLQQPQLEQTELGIEVEMKIIETETYICLITFDSEI